MGVEIRAYYLELWRRFGQSHKMFHQEAVECYLDGWANDEQAKEAEMVLCYLVHKYTVLGS